MPQLLWLLPIIVVAALVASGRVGSIGAGLAGSLTAVIVALTAAPLRFGPGDAVIACAKGGWLAFLVGAALADVTPVALGVHSALLTAPLLFCALAGAPRLERQANARAWPLGAIPIVILTAAAALLLLLS